MIYIAQVLVSKSTQKNAFSVLQNPAVIVSLWCKSVDTVRERRTTERRITERRIIERRIFKCRITKRRITERRKLPNLEY